MGRSLAFDPSRYFIFCANVLGSPYGSSSPVTINPSTGQTWGPEFPGATVRDDVRLHRLLLDYLGVSSVAVVIGGSMGGMQVLEWALLYPAPFVRNIIPIATSSQHSAWGISWGEAQRQAIYSDPNYEGGYYTDEATPASGLAAARMAALLTYRSRDSFESRFGRREMESRVPSPNAVLAGAKPDRDRARDAHNDGYRIPNARRSSASSVSSIKAPVPHVPAPASPSLTSAGSGSLTGASKGPLVYSAQSYLRYQGDKFTSRFDANCYISITRKMDSHDVWRGRHPPSPPAASSLTASPSDALDASLLSAWHPLQAAPSGALVLAISSDALFTMAEQNDMVSHLPGARLIVVDSPEGHDGFLLEFEQINAHIVQHLHERLPEIYTGEPLVAIQEEEEDAEGKFAVKKDSVFGEAEADVTAW